MRKEKKTKAKKADIHFLNNMNYTELNEKLEQLREIVRQQLIKEKEANENAQVDKDLIT